MSNLPAYSPALPFVGYIPGGLQCGRMVRVIGHMPHGADRFVINLQTGPSCAPSTGNKALHISVRPLQNAVVRTHFLNGNWGPEERMGGSPIGQGQNFEIEILAEASFFKIAINGAHYCTFNHRLPLHSNANYIAVEGDCQISSISELSGFSAQQHHHHHHGPHRGYPH